LAADIHESEYRRKIDRAPLDDSSPKHPGPAAESSRHNAW
jgi:hypothetical protein